MTSNLGSGLGGDGAFGSRDEVMELLRASLKPEFLNRIDEVVMFETLSQADVAAIVDIQLAGVARMLLANGLVLDVTPAARAWIAAEGYDPHYGARPIKRTIQRFVVNDLSKQILAGTVNRDNPITIDADKAGLVFSN